MKRTASVLAILILVLAPIGAQKVFDPFTAPAPKAPVTDGAPDAVATEEKDTPIEREQIGFTWWNDGPEMIRRGNEAYKSKNHEEAALWYRDARLTARQSAVADYDLALASAGLKKLDDSLFSFSTAINTAGQDATLKTDALYGRGTVQLEIAKTALEVIVKGESNPKLTRKERESLEKVRNQGVETCLSAIDDLTLVQERDKNHRDAPYHLAQAQYVLAKLTKDPPPPRDPSQPQQQQEDGDKSQDQEGEDKDSSQQENKDSQSEGNQDQQNNGSNQDGQSGQGPEGEQEQETEESAQGRSQGGTIMTPEQAEQVLELLGQEETIRLRLPSRAQRPEKDW